jgi:hypothetical protein
VLYGLGEKVGLLSKGGNPVGLGLLMVFSIVPTIGCLLIGALLWAWILIRKLFAGRT